MVATYCYGHLIKGLINGFGRAQHMPLIDMKHLSLYVGEDHALRDEILSIYEDQLNQWVDTLHADMPDDDWEHGVHALKGASRGVGAWEIGDLCEEAESFIRSMEDKREKRVAMLKSLHSQLPAMFAEIARLCAGAAA